MGALRAQANTPSAPVLIGWLDTSSAETGRYMLDALNEGMAALGWRLGVQYRLEERYADAQVGRLPALAQELAATKPAVILALPSQAVVHAAQAAPKLRRVGFLADPTSAGRGGFVSNARRAAERFGFEAVIVDMAKPEDIAPAFVQLEKSKVQALVVLPFTWFEPHMPNIMQRAQARRWPVVGAAAGARQGALFTYGPDRAALARRAAYYVDRILKGAKPGDLPIEQPTTFRLVLNMKTAKTLGIVMPPSMLVRATEVIE